MADITTEAYRILFHFQSLNLGVRVVTPCSVCSIDNHSLNLPLGISSCHDQSSSLGSHERIVCFT